MVDDGSVDGSAGVTQHFARQNLRRILVKRMQGLRRRGIGRSRHVAEPMSNFWMQMIFSRPIRFTFK